MIRLRKACTWLRPDVLDLQEKVPLTDLTGGGGPLLVFVHGTFSTTAGGFGRLWTESPARIADLFDKYGKRVYTLDHATLCASPISNALSLAAVMPVVPAFTWLPIHEAGWLPKSSLLRAPDVPSATRTWRPLFRNSKMN